MKKAFLSACFLFLLAGIKAQQPKSKKPEIVEHREGGNPVLRAQQKQAKKDTAHLQVQKAQTIYLRIDSSKSGTRAVDRNAVSAPRQVHR